MGQSGRIKSLDGLRGIACLVVFFMHLGATVKPFGDIQYTFIPGNSAVLVFFVLSGVVLAIKPFDNANRGAYPWYGYFPRRLVRLMVPLFVAVLLGVVSVLGAQLLGLSASGASLETIKTDEGIRVILHDVVVQFDFLFSDVDRSNPPAWSMKWELWFSLMLPLCIYLADHTHKDIISTGAIFCAIFTSYFVDYPAIRLCLMFVLGVYLAKHSHALCALHLTSFAAFGILLLSIGFIELPELQRGGVFVACNPVVSSFVGTVRDLGCVLLVFLAINHGAINRFLSTGGCLFFGKLSYSLYLTHAIVVAGLHSVLEMLGFANPIIQCLIIIPLSLLAAYAFWNFIEKPSIEWSRVIGQDAD